MGKKWINIETIGQLYIEKILVTFDIPIMFVCNDNIGEKYLCLCIDEEIGQYVIVKVQAGQVVSMLKNEEPMEKIFRECQDSEIYITKYDFQSDSVKVEIVDANEIQGEYLPDVGAYYEIESDIITNYVLSLQKEEFSRVMETYSDDFYYVDKVVENNKYYVETDFAEKESVDVYKDCLSSNIYTVTCELKKLVA